MTKRITKDLEEIKKDPMPHISAGPVGDDLYHWTGCVIGPQKTPYEGGVFKVDILFPADYPFKPPKIKFITKIFHPNISTTGAICVSILKDDGWSPSLSISKVLLSIVSLLDDINADDPLVPEIAILYKKNINEFKKQAASWTKKYAN